MTFLRRSQGLAVWWKPEGRNPLLEATRHPRDYELMTILIPEMSEEDNQAALSKVSGYLTDVQAEIKETLVDSPWGRRRLAYTIRHEGVDYRAGFYVVQHFSALPTVIGDIERELKLDTNVIRYLLVSHDPKAGEKNTAQPEGEVAAGAETTGETPATTEAVPAAAEEAPEAPVSEAPAAPEEAQIAADEAPVVEDTTASGEATEAAVEETAATIDGEEEPAPADGAEAVTADTKES